LNIRLDLSTERSGVVALPFIVGAHKTIVPSKFWRVAPANGDRNFTGP